MTHVRLSLLCVAAIVAASCSKPDVGAEQNAAAKFQVALLSPGPVSDDGWNALAYEGLLAIRDQLGAHVAQVQTSTPAEFAEGFRDFARRGYQLVFGHGFEFQDAAAAVAPEHRRAAPTCPIQVASVEIESPWKRRRFESSRTARLR